MTVLRLCCVCLLSIFLLSGCKGGSSVTGRYRIEQTNNFFGEGAEKAELDLKDDKSFEITIGKLTLASGTYTATDTQLDLSTGSGNMGTSYKILTDKLVPVIGGKEITAWRFVRK
ncbi:MAG: hypothetical protein H7Y17_09755 [Chlorobia bacterium]|nr:hypothetical protein [Fimbriimonadaceae bacterium]